MVSLKHIMLQYRCFFIDTGAIMHIQSILKTVLATSLLAFGMAANAEVVNINAYYNGAPTDAPGVNTPVLLSVAAGTYRIEGVDTSFCPWRSSQLARVSSLLNG